MKTYVIKRTNPETALVDCFPWDGAGNGYRPDTKVNILREEDGLRVTMETNETPLLSRFVNDNSPVCTDSCMEFFLRPHGGDARYFNFE
ncbi:MAG: hypothetical protein LBH54_03065, partial [Clostridiales bacterium]|nr:hypothetical protein [Clostridiales bacterium]